MPMDTALEWAWIDIGPGSRVLHHGEFDDGLSLDDAADEGSAPGTTTCGRGFTQGTYPGLFTRMGAPRCKACCRKLNYPQGKGSPKNDDNCRILVESRLGTK